MSWMPKGYGGARAAPEQVKRNGWRDQGILVVAETTTASPGPSAS